MTKDSPKQKRRLFQQYYLYSYTIDKIVLPDLKFRHFRFQTFSNKIIFRRVSDVISSPTKLRDKFIRYVPMNAYFTPVKWLNPIYVAHRKDELDVMLSSPLYFDIDMKDLVPSSFSEAKRDTNRLIEFLEEEYGRLPDLIVFSGRQGFHVHFWDWDTLDIIRLSPENRLIEFKRRRNELLALLRKRNITVDHGITPDPFRIMKIPNSLHGKTGLVAKPISEVERFDPKIQARAFDLEVYEKTFELDWNVYE